QFGAHGSPEVAAAWEARPLGVDPVKSSNTRGRVTFAMRGTPDTRTTQMYINFGNNANLDASGFAPFGEVTKGMAVVDALYNGYGEGAPQGHGPDQGRIRTEGNKYLMK